MKIFCQLTLPHKPITKQDRLSYIDLLECIAIFFVVTYHSTLYSSDFLSEGTFGRYANYYFKTILSTCVPLFFFANGYLLLNKPLDLKKHLRKVFRLIVLVFVWAIILLPLYMMIAGEPVSLKKMVDPILGLDTKWSMNLFWYLGALVCIYIFFPVLKTAFDHNRKAFTFFTVACAILTFGLKLESELFDIAESFILHKNFNYFVFPFFSMYNPFRGIYGYTFVYFCGGGVMRSYVHKIQEIPQIKRDGIAIVGIIISCGCLFLIGFLYSKYIKPGEIWDVVWNGYDTIFTLLNSVFIFMLCINYTGNCKFIRIISQNTLGIYFLHGLFIRLTRTKLMEFSFLCNVPGNLLYAFLIICACLAVIAILKRIPVLKRLVQ